MRTHLFSRFVGMRAFYRSAGAKAKRKLLPGRRGDLEIIRAERRGWQTGAVEQIHHRIIGPAVADRDRLVDLRAAHDHFAIVDFGIGPDEFSVFAANGESAQASAARFQPSVHLIEAQNDFVAFELHASVEGSGAVDLFAVSDAAPQERQSRADRLLSGRMNVVL